MKRRITKVLILTLSLVLMTSQVSVAIPIQPTAVEKLDYLDVILEIIDKYYVEEIDADILIEGAFKGVFDELDPYSSYYNAEDYKRYGENTEGEFGGVGITVTKDSETDYIKIVSPIEGTPGDAAGLEANDLIIAVNGNSLQGVSLEDAVRIMRGEPGTKLRLSILKEGRTEPVDVDLTREIIEIHPVNYEIREDHIAYLRLKQFNANSAEDFREAVEVIAADKSVEGLVIDLRNNPGGRLDEVVEIADLFLEVGDPIVQIDYRAYEDNIIEAEEAPIYQGPMAVLINAGSASASEILSGALQDHGLATIVGVNSFGKGTVQSVIDLQNETGMKITIAQYLTANGNPVNEIGIKPDVEISVDSTYAVAPENFAPMTEEKDYVFGEVGLNVYGAQQRLKYLGYDLEVDGVFGDAMRTQLTRFQNDYTIEESGKLDSKTCTALSMAIENPQEMEGVDRQLEKAIEVLKGQ